MPDCFQFALGSRARQICDGESELSLDRTNRFRSLHGIDPLAGEDGPHPLVEGGNGAITRMRAKTSSRRSGGCCGGSKATPEIVTVPVDGTGVGGRLIEMFKSHGFEACDDCYTLANRMNEWGVDGCRNHLDEIVADIMPRALAWEAEKVGWWAKLLPTTVTAAAVQMIVEQAIATAQPLQMTTEPQSNPALSVARKKRPGPANRYVNRPEAMNGSKTPTGPEIEIVDLSECTRHVTFHVYPVKGFGAWQWNCDHLLRNADLFNGRRIVSIVTDDTTDSAEEVQRYLGGFTDEFIVMPNNPRLREVATWLPMLFKLTDFNSESDVTFACHAKGVRHKINADNSGSTLFRWTEAMWSTCSNWDIVRPLLEKHATAGSFRRFNTITRGFGQWHYSGTFYWWRNRDAFRRNWRYLPQGFFGTEAWPGLLFSKEESAVVFGDDVQDLYKLDYWNNVMKSKLDDWIKEHAA